MANWTFQLFPAIDILDGNCVRLLKGDYEAKTNYSANPGEVAQKYIDEGARWLHVVDLNGAKSGQVENPEAISEIVTRANQSGVSVQVGGGIRNLETMTRWLELGVTRCVVGTAALDAKFVQEAVERFGSQSLVVGLDGRNGKLAVRGWLEQTDLSLVELARTLYQQGVRHALVTDVERDGTLDGANLELAKEIQDASGVLCLASGGIRNVEDVLAAKRAGLAGAIAGKSLYAGTLSVKDALRTLEVAEEC